MMREGPGEPMTLELGDTVRAAYGDMHGRIGIIRRMFSAASKKHFTFGVAFSGEPLLRLTACRSKKPLLA
jgi:hypothetical protein